MADRNVTEEEVAELLQRTEEATSAYMRGDMDRYLALTRHAPGFTLMNPLGGAAARYDDRSESVKASASYFKAGEAKLELLEAHAWGDTVVLGGFGETHRASKHGRFRGHEGERTPRFSDGLPNRSSVRQPTGRNKRIA